MTPIKRIQDILFEELDNFRKDGRNTKRARVVSELSAQTICAIRAELENKRCELEIGKMNNAVKEWMKQDFSDIRGKNHGQ